MEYRTITITLGFDEGTAQKVIDEVVNDLHNAIYAVTDAGNYNDECPGYDSLSEVKVD